MRLLFLSNTHCNTNKQVIDQLKSWVIPDRRVVYFSSSPDPSRKYFADVAGWFKDAIGISNMAYLDANSSALEIADLQNAGAIYLSGGNTYHLLQALKGTGAAKIIRQLAMESEIPIIGVSAGGLCLTKDIRAATAENDAGITDFSGLGLVDFGFYPHYKPDAASQDEINAFVSLTGIEEVFALPEYSGLAVTKDGLTPLGEVTRFVKGSNSPEILPGSDPALVS